MASKTTNYNLHKIDLTDAPPDITVLNGNWDKIDTELKGRATLVSGKVPVEQLPSDAYAPNGLTKQAFEVYTNDDLINALNQALGMLEVGQTGFFMFNINVSVLPLGGGTWQLCICKQRSEYASVTATSYGDNTTRVMYISKYTNVWGNWTHGVINVSTASVG